MLRFTAGAVLLFGLLCASFAQPVPEQPKPQEFPFEPANALVKYDCTRVVVQADGKSDILRHYRTAVLTDRAIREYAQDVTVYNLQYDTVEIITARVHLPSGQIVDVSPESIKDVPFPAFDKFYLQNVREKIITFPELVQGAEIEVALREITREVPMDGHFDYYDSFEGGDPIKQKYVEINAPASMKFKWKTRNGEIPGVKSTSGDRTSYLWTMENIPQIVPEPGMPPVPEVLKSLVLSTVPDWQTWSHWYDSLSAPEITADENVRTTVNDLIKGKKNTEEKLQAVFYFVSNDIRYVETSLSGRKAGYKPEPATVTLRNKYGVCRDKAVLMVTMLREIGIPADVVLCNAAWKIDKEIPAGLFNHAIVAAYVDGHRILVDPTVEKTKEYLAANEQDKPILVCNKKGETLEYIPVEPSDKNLFEIRADSRLDEKGLFKSVIHISTRGFPDLIMRTVLQSMPPQRRTDLFKQLVQNVHPSIKLDTLSFTDAMDFSRNVGIHVEIHAENYSVPAGSYLLFKVPGQSQTWDFLTPYFLNGSELTKRRYDLRLESTFAVRVEEKVTFPKSYRVRSLPEALDTRFGDFHMARKFESAGNTLTVKRIVDFSGLDVPLSEYGKLQDMLRKNDKMARGQVVLVKS